MPSDGRGCTVDILPIYCLLNLTDQPFVLVVGPDPPSWGCNVSSHFHVVRAFAGLPGSGQSLAQSVYITSGNDNIVSVVNRVVLRSSTLPARR
jgi:hypothetical protein